MLYDYDVTQKIKPVHSVYLGIDKIMVDDSYILTSKKILEYINIKKIWKFYSK